jgi:hypothetical protein
MDPVIKRKLTICNLFANQNLTIKDICIVLDASKHQVVDALIEKNLIKERRRGKRKTSAKKAGSLSITPDATSEDITDSNSLQYSKAIEKPDSETESIIREDPPKASTDEGNKSSVNLNPPRTRRIA